MIVLTVATVHAASVAERAPRTLFSTAPAGDPATSAAR
jgi:hypothetical protein